MFGVFGFVLCIVLGVPNPLLLGIVAAIGDIIPIFGVPLAMAITMLVAFTGSTWQPVGVLVGYVIYGQLESHFLVPRIYSRTVNLSPLVVIVATVVGGALDGFIGILIGIPIAGMLKVILEYIIAERVKGREAAHATMHIEPTDQLGSEVHLTKPTDSAGTQDDTGEPVDKAIAPTYSPFESLPEAAPEPERRVSGARYVTLARVQSRRQRLSRLATPQSVATVKQRSPGVGAVAPARLGRAGSA
jgi:hypothetical protein